MKRKAKMKILPNLDMVGHEEPVFSQNRPSHSIPRRQDA